MDYALNHDMIVEKCPFCKVWGLSYPSSEEVLVKAHEEYRRTLKEKFPKVDR